jgi:hypothetical protein
MTGAEFITAFRSLVGNPTIQEIPDRVAMLQIEQALSELSVDLGFRVVTDDTSLVLQPDVFEYLLPEECINVIRAEWNNFKLVSGTIAEWNRGGVNWQTQPSGTPTQYAVLGRTFYVYPPPADDALDGGDVVSLLYTAASTGLKPGGVDGFTEPEYWLAARKAAISFLGVRPDSDGKNEKRLNFLLGEYKRRFEAAAKARIVRPEDYKESYQGLGWRLPPSR